MTWLGIMTTPAPRRIVVGTDGSENSLAAIKWALHEGSLRGVAVDVIHSWQFTPMADPIGVAVIPPSADLQAAAQKVLTTAMNKVANERKGVVVHEIVVQGSAVSTLLDAARTAELVVVGRRGHGGFVGLLLGSVATQVVNHAKCPVVVVGTH
jgi:nucleotide-binding universal stress UspA family protein